MLNVRRLVVLMAVAVLLACMVPGVVYGAYVDHAGYETVAYGNGELRASFMSSAHRWTSWVTYYSEFEGMSVAHWTGLTPQAEATSLSIQDCWQWNGLGIKVSSTGDGYATQPMSSSSWVSGNRAYWSGTTYGPCAITGHHFSGVKAKGYPLTSEQEWCRATAYFASTNCWVVAECNG
jgi:hypothetical protein